jgi:hypothetical protein
MAIAPQRTAIGIRRHFTTEGVHPYDEVAGSGAIRASPTTGRQHRLRAARRRGPRDLEPERHQHPGPEVLPGHPGTDERETSLKQVIDRVVDTITEWGLKDGYFEDDEEARAFSDELKHVIVHQKAAFNSPVWFNIGVEGVPQQASACQPYDALVNTPNGLVPIGRLVEENAVGPKVFDAFTGSPGSWPSSTTAEAGPPHPHQGGSRADVTADHLVWKCERRALRPLRPRRRAPPGRHPPVVRSRLLRDRQPDQTRASSHVLRGPFDARDRTDRRAIGEMDVYDIQTESGEYLSGNLRVHNCFILSVDDSMDSILNWYREEGHLQGRLRRRRQPVAHPGLGREPPRVGARRRAR